MKTNSFFGRLLLLGMVALAFGACKRQLAAKKLTKNMAAYIYAYSSGTVAREQPVRVRFTSALVRAEEVGKSVEGGVFSLNPSVAGNAIWEDQQTLRFTPENGFASGQNYVAAIKLRRLFKNVPADAEEFQFDFRSRELYFDVVTDGIQPENGNDMSKQELVGEIVSSDRADEKQIEQILTSLQTHRQAEFQSLDCPKGQRQAVCPSTRARLLTPTDPSVFRRF